MAWLSSRLAGKEIGIDESSVRERGRRPPDDPLHIQRRPRTDGGQGYEYLVEERAEPREETGSTPSAEPADLPYYYADDRDLYVFAIPSKSRPFPVPGDTVRSLVAAYSNASGSPATVNEIARKHSWRRQTVVEVLRALGKTHDSMPFSDEELVRRDETSLVEDVARMKEERVAIRAERERWEKVKQLAERAEHFDRFVFDRVRELPIAAPERPPRLRLRGREARLSVMCTATDLHVGKGSWLDECGEETTIEITRQRLLDTTTTMVSRVVQMGGLSEWIVGVGSDWFHVDNYQGGTTRGTPMDTDGSFARIWTEGAALARDYFQMLRQAGPIRAVCMSGNHDHMASLMLTHWLAAVFESSADVKIDLSSHPRHYVEAGKNLIGITHGNGIKDEKLPGLMAVEASEAWGRCPYRTIYTGDLHTQIVHEYAGTLVVRMPSLAGTDRWHVESGYVGNRKVLAAYLHDHDEGLVGQVNVCAS